MANELCQRVNVFVLHLHLGSFRSPLNKHVYVFVRQFAVQTAWLVFWSLGAAFRSSQVGCSLEQRPLIEVCSWAERNGWNYLFGN